MQAGILEAPSGSPDLTRAIMADRTISEEQKQALVRIYLSFRRDYEDEHGAASGARAEAEAATPTPPPTPSPAAEVDTGEASASGHVASA